MEKWYALLAHQPRLTIVPYLCKLMLGMINKELPCISEIIFLLIFQFSQFGSRTFVSAGMSAKSRFFTHYSDQHSITDWSEPSPQLHPMCIIFSTRRAFVFAASGARVPSRRHLPAQCPPVLGGFHRLSVVRSIRSSPFLPSSNLYNWSSHLADLHHHSPLVHIHDGRSNWSRCYEHCNRKEFAQSRQRGRFSSLLFRFLHFHLE